MMAEPTHNLDCDGWIRWSPDQFYWAILDRTSAPEPLPRSRRARDRRLGYQFENVIPAPIESIHAVYRELSDGRWLAIGVCRDKLANEALKRATRLTPTEAPAHLVHGLGDLNLDAVNLLTDGAEPPRVRLARQRSARVAAVCCALIIAGLLVGTERRRRACEAVILRSQDTTDRIYAALMPGGDDPSLQPVSVRFTGELRRLRAAESGSQLLRGSEGSTDAAASLVEFMARWPRDGKVRTESISVSGDSIMVVVLTESTEDASRFASAWMGVDRWRGRQPQVRNAGREGVRLTLRFDLEPSWETSGDGDE